jgi:hypothetical protein
MLSNNTSSNGRRPLVKRPESGRKQSACAENSKASAISIVNGVCEMSIALGAHCSHSSLSSDRDYCINRFIFDNNSIVIIWI